MAKKHGHHGGAWKVAYADFVTAMMALFLVLWLVSQDQKIKEAVERAFRNPFASVTKESTGIIPNKDYQAVSSRQGNFDSASVVELNMLRRLNDMLKTSLEAGENESTQSIKLELTPEGLKINVFDRSRKPIFEPDSTVFTEYGGWVFDTLAWEISRFSHFNIELEGHTEQGHRFSKSDYGAWELSADRGNAARRRLLTHGVKDAQIRKVAGYADTQPMPNVPPEDESNNRVTVMLRLTTSKSA